MYPATSTGREDLVKSNKRNNWIWLTIDHIDMGDDKFNNDITITIAVPIPTAAWVPFAICLTDADTKIYFQVELAKSW